MYVELQLIKNFLYSLLPRLYNKNTVGAYILQAEKALFAFIVLPLLANRLGISVFGTFSTFLSLSVISGTVVDWGFSQTAVQSLAIAKKSEKSHIAAAVILARQTLTIPVALIVLALCFFVPALNGNLMLGIFAVLAIYATSISPLFIFQAYEKNLQIGALLLVQRLIMTVLTFAIIKVPEDLNQAFFIYLLFMYMGVGLGWVVLVFKYKFRIKLTGAGESRRLIVRGFDFAFANIGSCLYGNGSIFLLSTVSTSVQVGMYSLAFTFIRGICSVLTPVSQSYLPKISRLYVESFEDARRTVRKALILQTLVASTLVFVVWVVMILLTSDSIYSNMHQLSMLIILLSPTIASTLISSMLVLFVIIPTGMNHFYRNLIITSSIFSSACLLFLGYFYQGYGAALSIMITEVIVCIIILNRSMRVFRSKSQ